MQRQANRKAKARSNAQEMNIFTAHSIETSERELPHGNHLPLVDGPRFCLRQNTLTAMIEKNIRETKGKEKEKSGEKPSLWTPAIPSALVCVCVLCPTTDEWCDETRERLAGSIR